MKLEMEFGDKRRNDRRHITVAFRRLSRNFKKSSVFFFFFFGKSNDFLKIDRFDDTTTKETNDDEDV